MPEIQRVLRFIVIKIFTAPANRQVACRAFLVVRIRPAAPRPELAAMSIALAVASRTFCWCSCEQREGLTHQFLSRPRGAVALAAGGTRMSPLQSELRGGVVERHSFPPVAGSVARLTRPFEFRLIYAMGILVTTVAVGCLEPESAFRRGQGNSSCEEGAGPRRRKSSRVTRVAGHGGMLAEQRKLSLSMAPDTKR